MTRALLVVLLLGAALRVVALDKPFFVDEMSTITVATHSFAEMPSVMRQIDASPGLYPILLHLWLTVSHSDAWTRLLSALCGMTLVYIAFLLGRRAFGERTGLCAAFVVAIAPVHIEYAQYVRSYSLFTLLAALQMYVFFRCIVRGTADGPLRAGPFVAFALLTAALFYTHYLSLLLLAPEGVYAVWRLRDAPKRVFACGAAVALAAVLFIPGVPLLRHNLEFDAVRNLDRDAPQPVSHRVPDLFLELSLGLRNVGFGNPVIQRTTLIAGLVVFGGLTIAGIAAGWRRQRDATIFLALAAALPIAIYVLSGRKMVHVRFFVPFGVAYLVLVAHGLASLRRPLMLAAGAALAVICAVPIVHFVRDYAWSYDHRAVARAIDAQWQPGDVLLFVHPYEQFYYRWYLGPEKDMIGLVFTALEDQGTYQIAPASLSLATAEPRVLKAAGTHSRLWLIGQTTRSFASPDPKDEPRLLAWMDQTFNRVGDLANLTHDDPVIRVYTARAR